MLKRICSLIMALLTVTVMIGSLSSCTVIDVIKNEKAVKIGAVLLGDEDESYTKAHMDGLEKAVKEYNKTADKKLTLVLRKNVDESSECLTNIKELVDEGCEMIISNSYGHQNYMKEAATLYSDIQFVAMTGDFAAVAETKNLINAYSDIYEARYVSGVVAGLKLKELIEEDAPFKDHQTVERSGEKFYKVGYVAPESYPEVISGYTAFFLGVRSIVPNTYMSVRYTHDWNSEETEKSVVESLIQEGCVLISQHTDSLKTAEIVEKANKSGETVFSVGYNTSALKKAPNSSLTSATTNWDVYYKELFQAFMGKKELPSDWSKGYEAGAVGITKLGKSVAKSTKEQVLMVEKELKEGKREVFDVSTFTVKGTHLTSYEIDFSVKNSKNGELLYKGPVVDVIKTENGITYFDESSVRSAPYFDLQIDGIVEY